MKRIKNHPFRTVHKMDLIFATILNVIILSFGLGIPIFILVSNFDNPIFGVCLSSSCCFFFLIFLLIPGLLFTGGPNPYELVFLHGLKEAKITKKELIIKKYWKTKRYSKSDVKCEFNSISHVLIINQKQRKDNFLYVEDEVIMFLKRNNIDVKNNKDTEKMQKSIMKIFGQNDGQ